MSLKNDLVRSEVSPGVSMVKTGLPTRDTVSISGLGRFPGEENGNPVQFSCLGNPMDRGTLLAAVQGVAKEFDTT